MFGSLSATGVEVCRCGVSVREKEFYFTFIGLATCAKHVQLQPGMLLWRRLGDNGRQGRDRLFADLLRQCDGILRWIESDERLQSCLIHDDRDDFRAAFRRSSGHCW